MLIRYNKKLKTSGLQFSFKAAHSKVMSSLSMKDVVNYSWNRHSKVYVALIDASKAFDRARYGHLFYLLYKRSIPPIYIDELLNQLQASGIGCHIGHGHFRPLGYAYDLKLLCPGLRDLQKMVTICEQYGDRFRVSYNATKSLCITFDRAVDWKRKFIESISVDKIVGSILEIMFDMIYLRWKKSDINDLT